ncbi:hypothetical protein BDQ17DRAFT_1340717 [Cyathus striatus]|nr:hypothetical protein BDQ17DRAFT_1340717 [Cyathus striatus]
MSCSPPNKNTASHHLSSPSTPSLKTLGHTSSVRSLHKPPPPPVTVVTSPPWARDEPPSPKDQTEPLSDLYNVSESRPSDVASFASSSQPGSRWWIFALPRTRESIHLLPARSRQDKKSVRDHSVSWLPTSASIRELREGPSFLRREKERDPENEVQGTTQDHPPAISLPTEPTTYFTLAHSRTPGWSSPWTPSQHAQGPVINREESYGFTNQRADSEKEGGKWKRRRRRIRSFILTNVYVPLLFRFINITFTGAALGMAIRIRNIELRNRAMGAVGSSPTVVIIFAPLTLVHVIGAIYLEYFGRPLGLWRTTAKLAHTLSEVLFICAWSAALSLCCDNFFTSLIPCAPASSTSWYNELPRPSNGLPSFEGSVGDHICDDQLALIGLVFVGLIAYCSNLVISLYRIFEKVKYHPPAMPLRTS